ncbi:MAG TPA: SPFH domain-containing protein [Rhizomicrobium sp.]|nr:SPFH domain-containing protein [Rhizomicrobium sp.]
MADHRAIQSSAERHGGGTSGVVMAFIALALGVIAIVFLTGGSPALTALGGLSLFIAFVIVIGFYTLQPNEAAVITLFGRYTATDRSAGLRWVFFLYARRKVSLRVRNITSDKLKVNDKYGNPIEIAVNVVWRIADTAQAVFDVDNFASFINIQIETGLRDITSRYAYDHGEEAEPTLRADADVVSQKLRDELQERVAVAGIAIDEARISHLAYAQEIAGAMLRRQQAQAIIAARKLIVTGAVSMVENALQLLSEHDVVRLDENRKAQMVSNLLVVLCADRDAQPVMPTGSMQE